MPLVNLRGSLFDGLAQPTETTDSGTLRAWTESAMRTNWKSDPLNFRFQSIHECNNPTGNRNQALGVQGDAFAMAKSRKVIQCLGEVLSLLSSTSSPKIASSVVSTPARDERYRH